MSDKINFLLFPNSVTVILRGKSYTVQKDSPKYVTTIELLKENNEEELFNLLNIVQNISSKLGLLIEDGIVSYNGEKLPAALNRIIVAMYDQGLEDVTPLINFWNKLRLNVAYRPLNFLSEFIEAKNVVINADGNLILYKIVARTSNPNVFLDLYTRKFRNELGVAIEMPRNKVDDNIDNTCSHGFHVCTWEYLPHYGNAVGGHDAIILVEVDPRDIVAIPRDYANSKLRVCKYIPVEEYKFADGELKKVLFGITETTPQSTRTESNRFDSYEEEDNDDYEDLYDNDDNEYDDDED